MKVDFWEPLLFLVDLLLVKLGRSVSENLLSFTPRICAFFVHMKIKYIQHMGQTNADEIMN